MSEVIEVFADGGVIDSNPSPVGGTWAFTFVKDGKRFQEHSGIVPPEEGMNGFVTNNVTELYALCMAIWSVQTLQNWHHQKFHFYSDSKVTITRVFRNGQLNNVPEYLAELTGKVRTLLKFLEFEYTRLDGHPNPEHLATGIGKRGGPVSEHNKWCDTACGKQAAKYKANIRAKKEQAVAATA